MRYRNTIARLALAAAVAGAISLASPGRIDAARIGDVTRLGGERTNVLTGLGLVVGLPGTGDGGAFQPATRPLREMLRQFANAASEAELVDGANVALVTVTVTVPRTGARAGDALDVQVSSMGPAVSLRGGRLFVTPLAGPKPMNGRMAADDVLALAGGNVLIEDVTAPTVGVVKGGATMEQDLILTQVDPLTGRFQLILDDSAAGWGTASAIATMINDAEGGAAYFDPAAPATAYAAAPMATAVTSNTVIVTIPEAERADPAAFLARVQRLPVPTAATEARVEINDRTGTMVLTGDVEIGPVVVSHKGLTITTVTPPPVATLRTPLVESREAVAIDTTGTAGAKLQDLVDAMDQLKVPAEDRIAIIKMLHESGQLHAKVYVNGQPI